MSLKDPMKWNARMSAVYAVGIWTMVGSYAYFKYTGRYDGVEVRKEVEEPIGPNQKVYQSAHYKSVISYKEGFVPYSTRLYNFIMSFSGEPGPEDGKK